MLDSGLKSDGHDHCHSGRCTPDCPACIREERDQLKAALEPVPGGLHDGPDHCPLYYDGCHCGEAYEFWRLKCGALESCLREAVETADGYLREYSTPVPDLGLRVRLRERLGVWLAKARELLGEK